VTKILSREAQAQARAFVSEHGRPLEQAKVARIFEHSPVEAIWEALSAFQNADGGFGHGLEPDLQVPDSSAYATTVALQVLREFGAPPDHPLVQGAIRYLLTTYDAATEVWPIIPATANDAPHAPWWLLDEGLTDRFGGFRAFPRAEIVGYMVDYAALVPQALRDHLTTACMHDLRSRGEKLNGEEIPSYVRLAQTEALPETTRAELVRLLTPVVDRAVVKDPALWGQYGLTPLHLVEGPDSPLMGPLADVVSAYLDHEISRHAGDGIWQPPWTWYGMYPEAWPQARQDWSGYLTVRMLAILKRFGRLET
jgi:hypothetical protein